MDELVLRRLVTEDLPVLKIATLANLNWCGERFTMGDIDSRQEFRHYAQFEPGRGDFGVVADQSGQARGVAWAVFLPSDDPGYGFIDAETPEVSIWVHPEERGRGLGRRLLRELKRQAHGRGTRALTLSVEEGNFAKRLYESEGFVAVPGREQDGVMVWRAPPSRGSSVSPGSGMR